MLFTAGHFIHTEPYAFTVAGQPWINPEWLAEVPFWLSNQVFGLRGIYLVTWLVIAANILLVYARGFASTRNPDAPSGLPAFPSSSCLSTPDHA